jgi:hypothetical protein
MPKMIETGAVGHSKIARKYRFLAIGEMHGAMKANDFIPKYLFWQ